MKTTTEVVHEGFRRADERGSCGVLGCREHGAHSILCDEMSLAIVRCVAERIAEARAAAFREAAAIARSWGEVRWVCGECNTTNDTKGGGCEECGSGMDDRCFNPPAAYEIQAAIEEAAKQ